VQRDDDVVDGTRPEGHPALARILRAQRTPNRIDVPGVAAVMTRLENLGPTRPSAVVNSGDVVTGIWRLAEPIHEVGAASFNFLTMISAKLGHRVALRLGGDCRFAAEPQHQTVELVGTKREDISPAHMVVATVLNEERVTLEQLERLAAGG